MISDGFRVTFLSSLLHVLSDNVLTGSLRPAGPASCSPGAFGYLSGLSFRRARCPRFWRPQRASARAALVMICAGKVSPPEKSARGFLAKSENADVNSEVNFEVNSEVNFEVNFR